MGVYFSLPSNSGGKISWGGFFTFRLGHSRLEKKEAEANKKTRSGRFTRRTQINKERPLYPKGALIGQLVFRRIPIFSFVFFNFRSVCYSDVSFMSW